MVLGYFCGFFRFLYVFRTLFFINDQHILDIIIVCANEYIKINELLTKGYSYQIDSDNSFEDEYENPLTCYVYLVYKLTEKHINEITPVQTIIALLAQDIYYSFKIIGDTKNLYFRAYYKTPSINKITTYTNKLLSKINKKFILHPSI